MVATRTVGLIEAGRRLLARLIPGLAERGQGKIILLQTEGQQALAEVRAEVERKRAALAQAQIVARRPVLLARQAQRTGPGPSLPRSSASSRGP